MLDKHKGRWFSTILKIFAGSIFLCFYFAVSVHCEEIEENSTTMFSSDVLVAGKVQAFNNRYISVKDHSYHLCKKYKIFTQSNEIGSIRNLDSAIEVKLYIDKSSDCVRKVKIIRSAE